MNRLVVPAFAAWLVSVCFVPYWLGVNIGIGWAPATLVSVGLLAVLMPMRELRPGLVDAVLVFVLLGYALAVAIGDTTLAGGAVLITQWGFGSLAGRAVTARLGPSTVSLMFSLAGGLVAVLAIVEFATGTNVFVQMSAANPLYTTWGDLQERGGIVRAEGAFGHSLALGGALSIAIPFALSAPIRQWQRLLITLALLTAVTLTFSRTAMVCAIVALLLTVLLQSGVGSPGLRVSLLAGASVVGVAFFPLVASVFTQAGEEANNSAAYRGELLPLFAEMQLVGQSPAFQRTADGRAYFGNFRSIDSAIILTGLTYGLVPLLLLLAVLVGGIAVLVRGEATAGTVAVVAQLPALATVAFITQYTILFWFVAGVAVTSQQLARAGPDRPGAQYPVASPIPVSHLTRPGTP